MLQREKRYGRKPSESVGFLLYVWWNVWKKRNKRIFNAVQHTELQVALTAKEEIELCASAFSAASSLTFLGLSFSW
jgi:hypothetical protein